MTDDERLPWTKAHEMRSGSLWTGHKRDELNGYFVSEDKANCLFHGSKIIIGMYCTPGLAIIDHESSKQFNEAIALLKKGLGEE